VLRRPPHNLAQIVGMEGDRRIITELNGDDVTNCVIAEDVNDDADRARAKWPWLFLGHLIVNAKFRCGHRPVSSASNASLIGTSTIIDILFSRSTGTFVPVPAAGPEVPAAVEKLVRRAIAWLRDHE
jgi:hypothetical protein